MRNQFLLEMRALKIITIPEYMVLMNFYAGNWDKFITNFKWCSKNNLRKIYISGFNKILRYKKSIYK